MIILVAAFSSSLSGFSYVLFWSVLLMNISVPTATFLAESVRAANGTPDFACLFTLLSNPGFT
jgi:hypothetical protein